MPHRQDKKKGRWSDAKSPSYSFILGVQPLINEGIVMLLNNNYESILHVLVVISTFTGLPVSKDSLSSAYIVSVGM